MPVSTSRAAHHPQPAPADLPKDGGRFDLAIALGILAASGQLPGTALDGLECLGELALSGAIRPVRGVLPAALAARDARRVLVVPKENAEEASLASGLTVFAVDHLLEIAGHLSGQAPLPPPPGPRPAPRALPLSRPGRGPGQAAAAPCWRPPPAHNLLLSGPPGTGRPSWPAACPACCRRSTRTKPWRSRRSIRWPATSPQALAAATVPPAAPLRLPRRPGRRRQPPAAGRDHPGAPGRAVPRRTAGVRAQGPGGPARAAGKRRDRHCPGQRRVRFPARFQLVAAMNPRPCGYLGDPSGRCRCTPEQVQRPGKLSDRCSIASTCTSACSAKAPACSQDTAKPLPPRSANGWAPHGNGNWPARAAPMPISISRRCTAIVHSPKRTAAGWRLPESAWNFPCAPCIAYSRWPGRWPTWSASMPSNAGTWRKPCSIGHDLHVKRNNSAKLSIKAFESN